MYTFAFLLNRIGVKKSETSCMVSLSSLFSTTSLISLLALFSLLTLFWPLYTFGLGIQFLLGHPENGLNRLGALWNVLERPPPVLRPLPSSVCLKKFWEPLISRMSLTSLSNLCWSLTPAFTSSFFSSFLSSFFS